MVPVLDEVVAPDGLWLSVKDLVVGGPWPELEIKS